MRADQHKNNKSKGKLTFLLILIVVFIIGFIGYQTLNTGKPIFSKSQTESSVTKSSEPKGPARDKELDSLSEAMESVSNLYKTVDLIDFKDGLTNKEVEDAKKKVDSVSDKSKAKKELVDRIKEAQKFVKTKESK